MKHAILFLAVLCAPALSAQQTTFITDHPIDTWTGTDAVRDVRVFDVDNDGDQDVFVNRYTLFGTGTLMWYRNNGLGTFAPGVVISSGTSYAEDFDLGDLDGDGDLDVVYNAYPGGIINVRLHAAGVFGPPQVWGNAPSWARYLRLMQLDPLENNTLDLVVHTETTLPNALLNTGGAFGPPTVIGDQSNFLGPDAMQVGNITGNLGDVVVWGASTLWLHTLFHSQNGYYWVTSDLGYCDDRIQVIDVDGDGLDDIGRTNNDSISFTHYNDGFSTQYESIGHAGFGIFGLEDCDEDMDVVYNYGQNDYAPYVLHGYVDGGFGMGAPNLITGVAHQGTYPVLVDFDLDGLNDLLQVEGGNSLHWYTNGGPEPPLVTLPPITDTLVTCQNLYFLQEGSPSGGYFTGPLVYYDVEFGYALDRIDPIPGNYPVTYHVSDNNGCASSATQYVTVVDSVQTIPTSLDVCPSNIPYQLESSPANAAWLSDNYVTSDGLLNISYPYQTDILCYWTDVTGCGAYGSLPVQVRPTDYGDAHIYGWEGPDILCLNDDPVQIYQTLEQGGFELIPFDPAVVGVGTYTFIGYADVNSQAGCFYNDTLFLQVLEPPVVTLSAFTDTLANTCNSGYLLTGGLPTDGSNYWSGTGVQYFTANEYVFNALDLEGNIPVTYVHYDSQTGCSNTATQPITVIDSVVVVPDSINTCPSPDPIQVLTYPNAVWGSNEVTGGIVDVSFPHQQHYLCYWTDVMGCGVYGALAVNVAYPSYGYAVLGCECSTDLCTNGDPVTIYRSLPDGSEEPIDFDPAAQGVGYYYYVGYGPDTDPLSCPVNDTLFLQVSDPPTVTLDPFLDTLVNSCQSYVLLTGGSPTDGYNYWEGPGVQFFEADWYFFTTGLVGDIPITYTHQDAVTGCSNSATQYITMIDQVTTIPPSLVTCPSDVPYQLASSPANATWFDDGTTNATGLVDISQSIYTYAYASWTDVLGCEAQGETQINVQDVSYGQAYISGWEGPDILCTNSDPVQIHLSRADGGFDLIPFDPSTSGLGTFQFIGIAEDNGQYQCFADDTLFLQVLDAPVVTLEPFLDTLANACASGYVLTGGTPTDGYNYYDGAGVDVIFNEPDYYVFNALDLEGDIPVTYYHYDYLTGCSNFATQPITVIDSVVVVPDSIVTCPSPDPIQVLTYPNAVWGSNEVPNGVVDVSFPHQQHYLCYWTDVTGCAVPGALAVNVLDYNYGYAYASCECTTLCTNGDPVTIYRSLSDGSEEQIDFDPAAQGAGYYYYVGYGLDNGPLSCPLNDTLFLQVVDPPVVTLSSFQDTLVGLCPTGALPLTGGLPTDGYNYYDGTGVFYDGISGLYEFSPYGLVGDYDVTYHHTDNSTGCSNTAVQVVHVIDAVAVDPDVVNTCPDVQPVQLSAIPASSTWGGAPFVSPDGLLDVSVPYTTSVYAEFIDVLGCSAFGNVDVNVYDYSYGTVEVVGYAEPVSLCVNTPPVDVLVSQLDGSILTQSFDPSQGVGTYDIIGFGPTSANCPVNYTLTITVNGIPDVTLAPFTDTLVSGCSGSYVLTGGLPAGGYYDGPGVDGDFYPFSQSGQVPITYQYTDGNGCTAYATEDITVIDQITAVPAFVEACPDSDPVQLASVPPGAVWSGNPFVTPGGFLDVSIPNNIAAIGTWTDVIGCATEVTVPVTVYQFIYGTVEVVGYDEPVSLCVNTPPVTVLYSIPPGQIISTQFDPSQGAGTYDFTGNGPNTAGCPVDYTLTITVNDIPSVTLAPFTDTLVSGCAGGYVLTGGLPAGGYYDGPGVDGDFYPFAQSGLVPITYQYTDGNGCTAYDTEDITVIDQVTAVPDAVTTCPDADPVQLASVPPGAVWGGSTYVTPGGSLDVSTPNNEAAIGTWTDVIGCAVQATVPVAVYDFTYGTVEVVGYAEPVSLCVNTPPVDVLVSQLDGSILTQSFDPSQGVGTYDIIGFGPTSANCPVNYTLTITVNGIPDVTLAPFTDTLVSGCSGGYVLTGGLPAGGSYDGPGVDGDFYPFSQSGQVPITYQYTDGNGCTAYDTEDITVIDQVTAVPDAVATCPDTDPVQLASVPPGAVWGGSTYVTPGGSLDVSTPNNEAAIGTWTDVIGCAVQATVPVAVYDFTYGTVEVVGYAEPVSLCLNTPPVDVLVSQLDGSIVTQSFDPSQGVGTYDITGFGPTSANCPVNYTLTITVNDIPDVTLAPFTDTLVSGCSGSYVLTGGLPAGGYYDGPGVDGDFYPFSQSGQVPITYQYTDGNGCTAYATEDITVIDQITAVPGFVEACPDGDPVQLASVPPGAVWSGNPFVTPGGFLDVSIPNNIAAIGTWTDVIGCATEVNVPVTVYDFIYGTVEVVGYAEPVSLCVNTPPVTVLYSIPPGQIISTQFDPSQGPGTYDFTGNGPNTAGCPVDYTLTITVNDIPSVTLAPFTDVLANACAVPYPLTGGLPTGGSFSGNGVNTNFLPQGLLGDIDITYTYTDGNGCSNQDTQAVTVIDQVTATPTAVTTCPDTDPVQLTSLPPDAVWSGSQYVTPGGSLDVSVPNNEAAIGTWTDVIGCAVQATVPITVYNYTYGTVEVVGYAEPVSLCVNTPAVDVLVSQADGSIVTQTFDPSQGAGTYDITGIAPTSANCPVNYTLTITVHDNPNVTLAPFTDTLANSCANGYVLTGGLPAGGTYSGMGVSGDFFPQGLQGQVDITYTYTDGNGCGGNATEAITVIDQVASTPVAVTTCPDPDPVQLQSDPPGAVWSGSPNVTSGGSLDVSAPFAADIIGTWSDVTGCDLQAIVPVTVNDYTYGQAYVEGLDEPVSLCVSGAPVTVVTSQPDGSLLSTPFDPLAEGTGVYTYVGYAPDAAACPVNDTLVFNVGDAPAVTLAPFTDTLANACPSAYVLTGGLPAGGTYSGFGVNGDFFPEGLLGNIDITYSYTDVNGCSGSATEVISVIGTLNTTPTSIETCPGPDPIQLYSDLPGTVWGGSANVTPGGLVDLSAPFTADIIGTWTDANGCDLQAIVPVTVNALTNGYAYVENLPEPVTLCQDHDPVTIIRSLAAGGEESITFDPSVQTPGPYSFTGFALASAGCPVDYVLTIDVIAAPTVSLALAYDEVCTGSTVQLSGGLPAGGVYVNYNGTGDVMSIVDGANAATYQYTDGNGCFGETTDQIIGFSVSEANGYDTATPDLCPDSDPLIFDPSPANGTWGGVMTGPEFDPATDAGGTWSYTVTDDAGGTCGIGGEITVLPYTAATLDASLTTVCIGGGPVQVFGTNALGGTIDGPLTLDDPLDPLNPAGTFDPSVGVGDYVFSMDVSGNAQSCAWSLEVTVTVINTPNVTVSTFTDTLLNICEASVYTLTQGLPAGGDWSGSGVTDNVFSPFGLSGPQTLTYTFNAGPGCQGAATGVIEVVSTVTATPYNSQTPLYACEDSGPVQLSTVPGGSVWSGAAVTPTGYVDMADPFSGILSYQYTDAADCQYSEDMQAVISPYSNGSVVIDPPGATVVCLNGEPFDIHLSTASGEDSLYHFDPLVEGVAIHPFTGIAPLQIDPPGCYQDYLITIQVLDSAVLNLPMDWVDPTDAPVTLTGGTPAGGTYSGNGVTGGVFDPGQAQAGLNIITYTVGNGACSATDTINVSPVGLDENDGIGSMTVWPVPTRDELFISLPAGSKDAQLILIDASGREVVRRTVSGGAQQTHLRWDIGSLANGSYTLWPTGRGNIAPARVVIAH